MAVGYDNVDTVPPPVSPLLHTTMGYSAGGLCSSVSDIYKWQRSLSLDRHELVSPETLERMFTPGIGKYGYGWYIEDVEIHGEPHKLYWQWGSYLGYHGFIGRMVDDGIFIIIQQNMTSPSIYDEKVLMPKVKHVVEILLEND